MKVGVIGAGTMGSGIAQAFAQTEGYEVYLCDINDEFAANGKKKIAGSFRNEIEMGLSSGHPSFTRKSSRTDGDQCLKDVKSFSQRIGSRVKKSQNSLFLIVMHQIPNDWQ